MGIGRDRKSRRASVAAKAWPAAVGGGLVLWYAADSLRHRRESGHGYELRGEVSVGEPRFMRDAEALTGAPVSQGNDAELLVNGDAIFPAYVGAIKDARETVNLLTYAYWRGDIATEVAETLCAKARDGVECNVLIDAVGGAKMQRKLIPRNARCGRDSPLLPPAEALRGPPPPVPHAPQAADRGRPRGIHRRRRHRRGVDRGRPGPRPLARHPRARARARGAGPPGRVRRELAGGDGPGARRRAVPARPGARSRTAR